MNLSVKILGNNSAIPAYGRHPTAQYVEVNGSGILLDCGEGTQMQMQTYEVHHSKIDYIMISHMHGDHYYGLLSLLSSMCLLSRVSPLTIFGPKDLLPLLNLEFFESKQRTSLPFDLKFNVIEDDCPYQLLVDETDYEIWTFPTIHGVPCHGFKIVTKTKGRKILPDVIEQYKIPFAQINSIKAGADFIREDGTKIANHSLTTDGPQSKSYAFTADTLYTNIFKDAIMNVDLLYHESTYMEDNATLAAERLHSTAKQAAQLAQNVHAKQLLLGHYSTRYKEIAPFAEEASTIFTNVIATKEGDYFEI